MCVCVCAQLLSCVRLGHPMDCSPPGSSVHGIFQARILEWVVLQGIFPTQGSNQHLLCLLHWQVDCHFTTVKPPVGRYLKGKLGLGIRLGTMNEGKSGIKDESRQQEELGEAG